MISSMKKSKSVKTIINCLAKEEDKMLIVQILNVLQRLTGNMLNKNQWLEWWEENKELYLKSISKN